MLDAKKEEALLDLEVRSAWVPKLFLDVTVHHSVPSGGDRLAKAARRNGAVNLEAEHEKEGRYPAARAPHKVVALNNIDWPYMLGVRSKGLDFLVGAATVGAWFAVIPAAWVAFKNKPVMKQLGFVRYMIVAGLFQTMMLMPLKMAMRWILNIKYIWITPWFNV